MSEIFKIRDDATIKWLLEHSASMINNGADRNYYFLPYWFAQNEGEDEFEMYQLGDHLPEELKKLIKLYRMETNEK